MTHAWSRAPHRYAGPIRIDDRDAVHIYTASNTSQYPCELFRFPLFDLVLNPSESPSAVEQIRGNLITIFNRVQTVGRRSMGNNKDSKLLYEPVSDIRNCQVGDEARTCSAI